MKLEKSIFWLIRTEKMTISLREQPMPPELIGLMNGLYLGHFAYSSAVYNFPTIIGGMTYWYLILMLALLYNAYVIPLRVCFTPYQTEESFNRCTSETHSKYLKTLPFRIIQHHQIKNDLYLLRL